MIGWMDGCVGEVKKITFLKKNQVLASLGVINYQCQVIATARRRNIHKTQIWTGKNVRSITEPQCDLFVCQSQGGGMGSSHPSGG